MADKKKTHRSKTGIIKCRVSGCGIAILAKNYRQHLTDKHPQENSFDLSPYGQTKLSCFYTILKQPLKRPANEQPSDSPSSKQSKESKNCILDINDAIHANENDTGQRSALDHATPLFTGSARNVIVSSGNLEKVTEDICVMKQNIEKNEWNPIAMKGLPSLHLISKMLKLMKNWKW